METNGVTEHSDKPDDKQRRGREKRGNEQLVNERAQDFHLAFRHTKELCTGALDLMVPIKYLSL